MNQREESKEEPPKDQTAYDREMRIFSDSGPGILVVKAALQMLLKLNHPNDSPAVLLSLLREVFGAMPDDYWQRLQHAAEIPCNQLGCDCHIQHTLLVQVIDHQRDIWRKANADLLKQQPPHG